MSAFLLVFLWRPLQSTAISNLAAVRQSQVELSQYSWPEWPIQDALRRTWQCGTVQLDMSLPERFDLSYIGKDNEKHRPIMLHRTVFGSIERFLGILIEHFEGKFPLWLAPVQATIIPIADRHNESAVELAEVLRSRHKEKSGRGILESWIRQNEDMLNRHEEIIAEFKAGAVFDFAILSLIVAGVGELLPSDLTV